MSAVDGLKQVLLAFINYHYVIHSITSFIINMIQVLYGGLQLWESSDNRQTRRDEICLV